MQIRFNYSKLLLYYTQFAVTELAFTETLVFSPICIKPSITSVCKVVRDYVNVFEVSPVIGVQLICYINILQNFHLNIGSICIVRTKLPTNTAQYEEGRFSNKQQVDCSGQQVSISFCTAHVMWLCKIVKPLQ